MTSAEMKYRFDIKMRDVLKAVNHPFTTQDINRFLNEAQLNLVKRYADIFERDEDARKILSVLVKPFSTETISSYTAFEYTNAFLVTGLPDFLNVVLERVNKSMTIKVKPMSSDEITVNANNPFKKPDINTVWRLDVENSHVLITDGTLILTSYFCLYIDMPPNIDIDDETKPCVLQEQIHEDIVNNAVQSALNAINRTLQLNKPLNN
mgnify:FL=1